MFLMTIINFNKENILSKSWIPKSLALILLTAFAQITAANTINIEHIANAGVKISTGNHVILIDALSGPNKYYNTTSNEDFDLLLKSHVDVTLATHDHSDHFSAEKTASFLMKNPDTLFISIPKAIALLADKVDEKQWRTVHLTGFESKQFNHKNISITALHFPHVGAKPDIHKFTNYAYLVTVNGWNILHVGDAKFDITNIDGLELAKMNIDVTLLPAWVPENEGGIELVKNLNLGKIVFMHLMDKELQTYSKLINDNLPEASMLATGYEKVTLNK